LKEKSWSSSTNQDFGWVKKDETNLDRPDRNLPENGFSVARAALPFLSELFGVRQAGD
jgi:hypothetical protein